MAYYPIFLELKGRPCVVIGGGQIAYRKAQALVSCGAKVTVVSPRLGTGLQRLARTKKVRWHKQAFQAIHLKGAQLVIAATDDQSVNEQAAAEAERRGIWINVVDQPRLCSFILSSVVRRGKLVLAISTGGVSPALAKWIRKDLQVHYGPEFDRLLRGMAQVRGKVKKAIPRTQKRKRVFEKALKAYFQVIEKAIS